MEKQARLKRAADLSERVIELAADEMAHNIKVAAHNQRGMLTGKGTAMQYKSGAFMCGLVTGWDWLHLSAEAHAE